MKQFPSREIAALALKSILFEIGCTPKPGLVDRCNSGAHGDMDYYSFVSSSSVLAYYFQEIIEQSFRENKGLKELLPVLRKTGLQAEKEMLAAANQVNTQKGLIFSLGIVCACLGYMIRTHEEINPATLSLAVKEMTAGLVKRELHPLARGAKNQAGLTKGQSVYLQYGATGIRGEVEAGFPSVLHHALPAFRQAALKSTDMDIRMLHTLLTLMSVVEDTLVLFKGGLPLLHFVQEQAALLLDGGSVFGKHGVRRVSDLDALFIRKNISPGGSADLLAVTLMFVFLEEYINKRDPAH
jgi:triphosphoribosyl-dephospho-CoA synthase CitG